MEFIWCCKSQSNVDYQSKLKLNPRVRNALGTLNQIGMTIKAQM